MGEREPIADVQVTARSLSTGVIDYVVTRADGRFHVDSLAEGEYSVWTCLDGFDQARFRLRLDPGSKVKALDVFLAPSEAMGRRDVVGVEEVQ